MSVSCGFRRLCHTTELASIRGGSSSSSSSSELIILDMLCVMGFISSQLTVAFRTSSGRDLRENADGLRPTFIRDWIFGHPIIGVLEPCGIFPIRHDQEWKSEAHAMTPRANLVGQHNSRHNSQLASRLEREFADARRRGDTEYITRAQAAYDASLKEFNEKHTAGPIMTVSQTDRHLGRGKYRAMRRFAVSKARNIDLATTLDQIESTQPRCFEKPQLLCHKTSPSPWPAVSTSLPFELIVSPIAMSALPTKT